jgi:Ca-activated chloride channel homolog
MLHSNQQRRFVMPCRIFRVSSALLLLVLLIGACGGPSPSAPASENTTAPPAAATTSIAATTAAAPTNETADPTSSPSATANVPTTESVTAEAATSAAALSTSSAITDTAAPRVLADQWYIDSDGNAIPDFIEVQNGFNPQADDCPEKDCGLGKQGVELTRRERNLLLILDSSGSMAAAAGGQGNKLDAAKSALSRYVQVASTVYTIGFMVYGHKGNNAESGKAESCVGIELLKPLGEVQRDSFQSVLDQFQPTGWTPIAAALEKSKEAFAGKQDAFNRIILVSDGLETCNGDPVAVAQQLHEDGLNVQVDVVGFDIQSEEEAAQLRRIAEVGGGEYYDAKTAQDLEEFLRKQNEALYQTRDAWTCEVQNLLSVPLCNQQVVNKALFYISDLQQKASNESVQARPNNPTLADQKEQEAQAYSTMLDRIYAVDQERQKKSQETVPRYQELERQMSELVQQYRQVYGLQ